MKTYLTLTCKCYVALHSFDTAPISLKVNNFIRKGWTIQSSTAGMEYKLNWVYEDFFSSKLLVQNWQLL